VTRLGGVYRRPHSHYRRLRYVCHGILLSLLNLPRGLSGPPWRSVSKATFPLPQASIRMPRHTTQPAHSPPWTEWSALAECIECNITFTAGFDTYATAYYSACLISPWTECSAKAVCTEGHIAITAGFDTYATAYYSACLISPWTECSEGVYRRPRHLYRRLRYVCHGILLSLLNPWTE
jgi:hypothetical protein